MVGLSTHGASHPNIVIVFADDMGYGDVGANNPDSKIATPHLDRLAQDGMRFTDAHAPGSVCFPSRYGLLTGRYPFRKKLLWKKEACINPERMTLASLLRDSGYDTAMIGKWHLGFDGGMPYQYDQPFTGGPADRGFDYFYGIHASTDIPPYFYVENRQVTAAPNRTLPARNTDGWTRIQGEFWREGEVGPDFEMYDVLPNFTRRAVKFITTQRDKKKPFFLYVPLPAPHTPWVPVKKWQGQSKVPMFGDFVMQVDDTLGQIVKALKKEKVDRNTIVIFTSDNGPVWYPADVEKFGHASTAHLRGMKGDAYEGGHRMPFIVSWPAAVQAGSVTDRTVSFCDLLGTFAEIVERKLPRDAGEDSISFLATLEGRKQPKRPMMVNLSSRGFLSIRDGDMKYIDGLGSGGFTQPSKIKGGKDKPKGQLFNLASDPGEANDLAAKNSDIVEQMRKRIDAIKSNGRTRN
ncbi:MAG: sulfatase family protein [Limisphaerales bacterium]